MKRIAIRLALCAAALVCGASLVQAQGFPAKPVRIVVPYPAGGSVDIVTRAVTQRLNAIWAQPIVIENKAGGGTQIGAEAVAKSAPDGYTLFATGMETFAITPFMHAKLSYDPDKDFTPVSGLGASNQFLVVPVSSQLKSVRDLIVREIRAQKHVRQAIHQCGGSDELQHRGSCPATTVAHVRVHEDTVYTLECPQPLVEFDISNDAA